jgi:hypothetical protein
VTSKNLQVRTLPCLCELLGQLLNSRVLALSAEHDVEHHDGATTPIAFCVGVGATPRCFAGELVALAKVVGGLMPSRKLTELVQQSILAHLEPSGLLRTTRPGTIPPHDLPVGPHLQLAGEFLQRPSKQPEQRQSLCPPTNAARTDNLALLVVVATDMGVIFALVYPVSNPNRERWTADREQAGWRYSEREPAETVLGKSALLRP